MERVVLALIITFIVVLLFMMSKIKETFADISQKKVSKKEEPKKYDIKKIMIWPPSYPHKVIISDKFRYKTWDGTNWECQIVNGDFYVRQMGSKKIYPVRVLNILRFRSQQWQVAYLKPLAKFLVYRFGGTIGMPFEKLNLVDWNDRNYTIKVIP